ncbi:MAG: carboxypeptidase regulatory-like domain-containing protein [Planctomyces sp.]|nr:carboxypeptidase regulatory-like domain-containing protein [Planctomyces sp.]
MQLKLSWAKTAAIVAGLNVAAPQAMSFAAEPTAPAKRVVAAPTDVVLTSAGELRGRVITAEGQAVDGAAVSLQQNGKTVGRATTTESGDFRLENVRGGVYQVSAGQSSRVVRAWTEESAPPAARPTTTLVQGNLVRGQDEWDYFETDEMVIAGIATAALIVGIIALVEANDNNSRPASN